MHHLVLRNKQTKSLLFPTSQSSSITVVCKFPRRLQLELDQGEAYEELLITPNSQVKGVVEALDEAGVEFYNASNVVYHFHSDKGVISGHDRSFEYVSSGQSDTIKIYCEKLTSGLRYKRVELRIDTSVTNPLSFKHALFNESERLEPVNMKKFVRNIVLFNPNTPYLLEPINASPLLLVRCTEAVSCERHEGVIHVNLLRVGTGRVVVRDRRVYGSAEWTFEFVIVYPSDLQVIPSSNYIQD